MPWEMLIILPSKPSSQDQYMEAYRSAPALLSGFDAPRVVGLSVFAQDGVVNVGVYVFRINKRAVDVKDASPNGWER